MNLGNSNAKREQTLTGLYTYRLGVGCCIYLFSAVFLGPISRVERRPAPFLFLEGNGRTLTKV